VGFCIQSAAGCLGVCVCVCVCVGPSSRLASEAVSLPARGFRAECVCVWTLENALDEKNLGNGFV
jgi:hypothetical protein